MRPFVVYIILFCAMFAASGCSKQQAGNRSIMSSDDSLKLSGYLLRTESSSTIQEGISFAQMLKDHAMSSKSVDDELRALHVLFELHFNNGKNAMALNVAQRAIDLNDTSTNDFLRARSFHYMGKYLVRHKNPTLAARNLSTSFKTFWKIGDTANVSAVFRDLVRSYNQTCIFDSARVTIRRCIIFDSLVGSRFGLAEDFAVLSEMYVSMFMSNLVQPEKVYLDSAKFFVDKAVEYNNSLPVRNLNVDEYSSMVYSQYYYFFTIYSGFHTDPSVNVLDSAKLYHGQVLKYVYNTEDPELRKRVDIQGYILKNLSGDIEGTKRFVDSVKSIADRPDADYVDKEIAYSIMALWAEHSGDFKQALQYRVMSDLCRDVYNSSNASAAVIFGIARGQYEGEQNRNRAMQMQMEGERRALIARLVSLSIVAVLLLVIGIIVYRNLKRIKKLNNQVNEANQKLAEANKNVIARNTEITESISYASIIQQAAMPSRQEIFDIFGENLILLNPRDIVSGDFFWASETGPYKLLVAGDCTGHGVPGALLSMLGMSILDYVTRHFGMNNISAGLVLDRMRSYFKRTLNQGSFRTDKAMDSIDLALIVVDTQAKQLHYAAAFRPLIYFRDGELQKVKADPMPIGVYPKERDHFANHVIDLKPGDVFYLFSDGIPDQSGYEGPDSDMARAFSNKRFLALLQEYFKLPFEEQKQKIQEAIENWRMPKSESQTQCEQTDDNVLVGIAVDNFMKF